MAKRYIFLGAALSVFLHFTFLRMPGVTHIEQTPKGMPEKCPIIAEIPKEPEVKAKPRPVEKKPVEKPEEKKEDMQEVFKPDSVKTDEVSAEKGNIKLEEPREEYMPALKMDISDYDALVGAINYFGMKIALMNNFGNFVDEIKVGKSIKIVPIEERLSEFSNRIRKLPVSYFGKRIEKELKLRELAPYMLVPAEVDRQFAALQKEVIAGRGYAIEKVKATAGKFIREGNAYKLVIEKLYRLKMKGAL